MNEMNMLPLFVAIPLAAAFVTPLVCLAARRIAPAMAIAVTGILAVMSAVSFNHGNVVYAVGGWSPPFGINMVGDGLSRLFLLMVGAVSFLVAVYSLHYLRRYTGAVRFYTLFLLLVAGMNGVVVSGDIFNMFVFLEIAAISSYALVAFGISGEELEAAFRYLVLGSIGSACILFGIAILYNVTGTLNLAHNGLVAASEAPRGILMFVMALFITGFGLKAALVPFHTWLPDAHSSAPAPISAMLSGLVIKVLGIYALLRVFTVIFGGRASTSLLVLGLLSMIAGAFLAVGQSDMKRMLAYSSISQMGYVIFAVGLATPLALLGAMLHLVNHAVFKSLLFLCAGVIEQTTGTRDLNRLGGLWGRMPVTSVTCMAGSLSISGVPPFGGFFSKLLIIVAAVGAAPVLGTGAYWMAGIAAAVGFLTLVYFVKLQQKLLFGRQSSAAAAGHDAPPAASGVLVVLALTTLTLGILFPWAAETLAEPAREALLHTDEYINQVLGMLP